MKALYRAGRVLGHLGEWAKAVVKLEKAAQLDPDNKVIQTELKKTTQKKEETAKKGGGGERGGGGGTVQEKEKKSKPSSSSESSWVCQ